MTASNWSDALLALLDRLESVAELDVLSVVAREPEVVWTIDQISKRLALQDIDVRVAVLKLHERRLISGTSGTSIQLAMADVLMVRARDELMRLYGRDRDDLHRAITERTADRRKVAETQRMQRQTRER